jgi:hypothetical protein
LLFGQVWSSAVSYGTWIIDSEIELIELHSSEEKESEEEENKKEKEDKLRNQLVQSRINFSKRMVKTLEKEGLSPQHHPELFTPPPEAILFS